MNAHTPAAGRAHHLPLLRRRLRRRRDAGRRRRRGDRRRRRASGQCRPALRQRLGARRDAGLEARLLYPTDPRACARPGTSALDARRRRLRAAPSRAWPRRRRLLSLRTIADRGLLRRQQADERLHRLGQCRHQFAALHGLVGGRPPPRLRRRHRAGLLRGPRRGRSPRAGRLQRRLVPSGAVPAHGARRSAARRAHRRRSIRAARRHAESADLHLAVAPGMDSVLFCGLLVASRRQRRVSIAPIIAAHTLGLRRGAGARARHRADRAATAAGAAALPRRSRGLLRDVDRHAARRHAVSARASTSRRRAPTRSTRSSIAISRPGGSASPALGRSR